MQLATVSVQIQFPEIKEDKFQELAERLQKAAVVSAREMFGPGFDVDVTIELGTLRARYKVLGAIGAIYSAIAVYPDFEAGLSRLYERAEQFTTVAAEEFKSLTGANESEVLSERRSFPGLQRISRAIEALESAKAARSASKRSEHIEEAVRQLAGLHRSDQDLRELQLLMQSMPTKDLPDFPKTPQELLAIDERRRRRTEVGSYAQYGRSISKPKPRLKYRKKVRT